MTYRRWLVCFALGAARDVFPESGGWEAPVKRVLSDVLDQSHV